MGIFRVAFVLIAAACGLLAAPDADAHRGRGRASVGIWFGGPIFPYYYPRYYYPPTYYYPPAYYPHTVVAPPAAPPVYIEQNAPPSSPSSAAESPGAYWYYCRDTQTYYPYVQQCASPWQQMVPQTAPPGAQNEPGSPGAVPRT